MTNNNWNTVNWDEIPEDVDAVVTFKFDEPSYYKEVDGELQIQCYRSDSFECSRRREIDDVIERFGDRFHLRPSPTSQPIPEPPESTQVETSEVEAATTPEFDWSSVEDDVGAVVVSLKVRLLAAFKEGTNHLLIGSGSGHWYVTRKSDTIDKYPLEQLKTGDGILIRRPPATLKSVATTPTRTEGSTAVATLLQLGYSWEGGEFWKPPLGKKPDFTTPSIHTILQEAQQSILKHHGVTGKVKFTVTCSE